MLTNKLLFILAAHEQKALQALPEKLRTAGAELLEARHEALISGLKFGISPYRHKRVVHARTWQLHAHGYALGYGAEGIAFIPCPADIREYMAGVIRDGGVMGGVDGPNLFDDEVLPRTRSPTRPPRRLPGMEVAHADDHA